jgi:ABC-type branched-subunit amino acid transport system substrate-binding protein
MCQTRNPIILFFILLTLSLSGCSGGPYGSLPKWDFNQKAAAPAQAAPNTLSSKQQNIPVAATPVNTPASPVKVAILLPLTGEHADLGDTMLKASQLALFDIAQENFELMPYDTGATAEGGRIAAEKAANDGAQLVLGPVFSQAVRGASEVLSRRNINIIAFSTDWSITGPTTYTIGMLPFDQLERIMDYSTQNNLRRIALIAPTGTYGNAIASAFETLAKQKGIQSADILKFDPQSKTLNSEIKRFARFEERAAQPGSPPPFDAVLIAAGGSTATTIANMLSQYDLPPNTVKRLGIGLFDDTSIAYQASLRESWFAAPSPSTHSKFENRYSGVYGSLPRHRISSLAYDATALASVLAARGINTTGKPGFNRAEIMNPNGFSGVDGIFRFLENGTAERGLSVLTFKNNTIQEISPAPKTFEK